MYSNNDNNENNIDEKSEKSEKLDIEEAYGEAYEDDLEDYEDIINYKSNKD